MNWNEIRLEVLRRDNYQCQTCRKDAVDVHHVISKRMGGLDVLENLTSVCAKCHGLLELKFKKLDQGQPTRLKKRTTRELKKIGKFGQSYDDVIRMMMRVVKG